MNMLLNKPFHPRWITADKYFFLCPIKMGQQSAVSTPKIISLDRWLNAITFTFAGETGLEPATYGFGGRCSTNWATLLKS